MLVNMELCDRLNGDGDALLLWMAGARLIPVSFTVGQVLPLTVPRLFLFEIQR